MKHLYCRDLIAAGIPSECCDSCHEDDEEFGIEMIFLEDDNLPGVDAYVCCGIAQAVDTSDKPLINLLTRALALKIERESHE